MTCLLLLQWSFGCRMLQSDSWIAVSVTDIPSNSLKQGLSELTVWLLLAFTAGRVYDQQGIVAWPLPCHLQKDVLH